MTDCPRCSCAVSLLEGRPVVTDAGVQLWHQSCWDTRHARGVEVVAIVAPRRRVSRRLVVGGIAAVAAVAAFAIAPNLRGRVTTVSAANFQLPDDDRVAIEVRAAAHEEAPPAPDVEARYPVPYAGDEPLDEQFPSLREWAHPVTDSPEHMPEQRSRWFGAERAGLEVIRPECGSGHCGVDLDGPRGQPVVSVADGVVVRVERHELGLDGRSGRYVRVEHEDGTLTAYMHLDDIADGIEVGDRVEAGQMLGTLGATAVYASVPHLHFSLEVPNHPGENRGDNTDTHYVDPAPFLVRATIVAAPDRRRPIKPAM